MTSVIRAYALQAGLFTLGQVAGLFLASGRLNWANAWAYLAVYAGGMLVNALVLIPSNPELVLERATHRGTRDLDRRLAGVLALVGPVAICVVAGLDARHGWSPALPLALVVAAALVAALGSLLTTWAMASNRFFYGVLRIEKSKGHTVATGGPYRLVRHPGYVGMIAFDLAVPLILGSLWALFPAALTACAAILRTGLEDQALQAGLDGYSEYARRVRHRLFPGLW